MENRYQKSTKKTKIKKSFDRDGFGNEKLNCCMLLVHNRAIFSDALKKCLGDPKVPDFRKNSKVVPIFKNGWR